MRPLSCLVLVLVSLGGGALAAPRPAPTSPVLQPLEALYPDLDALYRDLHQHPELSFQEEKTAATLAERLRQLGFEVTPNVGGHGLVGVLRNGQGPTVMLRTDLDGLPVEEKTGLPYASKAVATDSSGRSVPVMHACGHDIHMTAWTGAATLLARAKDRWRGTLMMVGQPAEEQGRGARMMLEAGLFTRFPKPDFAVAIHDSPIIPSGRVDVVPGYAFAHVDTVDITLFGKGGHGAAPHTTVDPIVLAARTILALQTIVSREKDPLEPAVITVGSIHGGTTHNVVPDEVRLQLTLRSYAPATRKLIHAALQRIVKAEAEAAGAPRAPEVKLQEGTPALYNDPALTKRLAEALSRVLGAANVQEGRPMMVGEDFALYGQAGIPTSLILVGAVEPKRYEKSLATGEPLPSLHSGSFAPDRERTVRTGVTTLTVSALELLGRP